MGLLFLVILSPAGCSGAKKKFKDYPILWSQQQADAVLDDAIRCEYPDDRRHAIEYVAQSRFVGSDNALKTLTEVVQRDPSRQVRISAARGLSQSRRPEAATPLLNVLNHEMHSQDVLAPEASLRRACLEALTQLHDNSVPLDDATAVAQTAGRLLQKDPDRDVKIAAAQLLGRIKTRESLEQLITALRDPAFAVNYQAEQSLIRLTGVTYHLDAKAWNDWLANTSDPFAHSGETPTSPQTPRSTWWPFR